MAFYRHAHPIHRQYHSRVRRGKFVCHFNICTLNLAFGVPILSKNILWENAKREIQTMILQQLFVIFSLDLILQKQIGLPVLMPYWDYRLDLALVKPTESLIFEQISTYNKNDQLGTNFSDLAQIISEQILLKRDQSMDDQIYQLLDNNADQKWMEYKQAFELSDYGDRKENAKILKLLLLISIDIGIGSEAQSNGKNTNLKPTKIPLF